jgi:hypothetical protein
VWTATGYSGSCAESIAYEQAEAARTQLEKEEPLNKTALIVGIVGGIVVLIGTLIGLVVKCAAPAPAVVNNGDERVMMNQVADPEVLVQQLREAVVGLLADPVLVAAAAAAAAPAAAVPAAAAAPAAVVNNEPVADPEVAPPPAYSDSQNKPFARGGNGQVTQRRND